METMETRAEPDARAARLRAVIFALAIGAGACGVGTLLAGNPILAAGGVLAVLLFGVFLKSPPLALLALVAAIPFEIEALLPGGGFVAYSGIKILGIMALLAWLGRWVATGDYALRSDRQLAFYGLFLVCLAVSAYAARNLTDTLDALLRWLQISLLYVLTQVLMDSRRQVQRLYWVVLLTMGLSALWGIAQGLRGERATGLALDPNEFCLCLIMALYIGLGIVFSLDGAKAGRGAAALAWGSIAAIVLAIILTRSRSGFLTLVASGMVWVLLQPRKGRGAMVLAAVAAAFVILAPALYWERITTLSRPMADDSLRGRMYEFRAGVLMIERHPILGVGTGNYATNYMRYSQDPRRTPRLAHNLYIQIGAENGLIGLTVFLLLTGYTAARLRRLEAGLRRNDPAGLHALLFGALLAFVAFLIGSLFLSSQFVKYFYVTLGLLPAWSRLAAEALAKGPERPSAPAS